MEPWQSEHMKSMTNRFTPPRRDASALGFGVAFLGLALLALLRAGGVDLRAAWLYAAAFIGLGGAGALIAWARAR
jgi:hypothetical protein